MPQHPKPSGIEFESVTKRYGETLAVENFSLQVTPGSLLVLLGSSGCGKTTLLRMVNRMVEPTAGRVLLDGTDVATLDPVTLRRSIGYVLQAGGLLPHRTVAHNVATVPLISGVPKKQALAAAEALLPRVGLDPQLAGRYPGQLSGGQQQRIGVARALAADPSILLLDEPFGAVDPIQRAELQRELRRLQDSLGKTTILVTHDVDEALRLGDEVVLLTQGGQLAQRGTPAELLTGPANDFVASFLGISDRELHVEERDGVRLVVDRDGRPTGLLA